MFGSCVAVARRVQPPADTLDSLWVAKTLRAWSSARNARRLALLRPHRLEMVDLW